MNILYNLSKKQDSIYIKVFHTILLLYLLYYYINLTIIITFGVLFLNRTYKKNKRNKSPISIKCITISGGFIGWNYLTIINILVNEFRKISVLTGWSIVILQVYYYNNPLKQYKSIPNNIIFLLGSMIPCFIDSYKQLIYEKKYNSQYMYNYSNNLISKVSLSNIKYGDILLLEKNIPIPISVELYSDKEENIKVNLSYVNGETKPSKKKCRKLKNIKNNNYIFNENDINENENYLLAGSIIYSNNNLKKKIYGRVIKINTNEILDNNIPQFTTLIEKMKFKLIILSGSVGLFLIILSFINNVQDKIIILLIQVIVSIQIIIPLSYNTLLNLIFIICSKFKLIPTLSNIPTNKYQSLICIDKNKKYLISDKTGTITDNNFEMIKFVDIENNKFYDLVFLADSLGNELEEIEMVKYMQNKYKIKYNYTRINDNLDRILKSINNKQYFTIFLGLFRKLGGTLTLVYFDYEYFFVYQGVPTEYLINQVNDNKNWKDAYYYRNKYNIDINCPTRDWFHAITKKYSFKNIIYDKMFNDIIYLIQNNNKYFLENITNMLIKNNIIENLTLVDLCIMNNPLKLGVRDGIYSFNSGKNCIICTGDNIKNTELVIKCILNKENLEYMYILEDDNIKLIENCIYIFKGTKYIFLLKNILKLKNRYIIFSSCTPNDKYNVVNYIKSENNYVIFTGDGINDILALKHADLGIAFPSNNSDDNINEYLDNVVSNSDLTIDNFSKNFWIDIGISKFEKDLYNLYQISIILSILMSLKCFKSGIQVGYLLYYNSMEDPITSIFYDLSFDIIIFFIWILVPIYLSIITNQSIIKNNFNFDKLVIISLFNYIFSSIISYIYFRYFQMDILYLLFIFIIIQMYLSYNFSYLYKLI